MRRSVVAGNWKMHGVRADQARLVGALLEGAEDFACDVLVCPPFPYLLEISRQLSGSVWRLGAQDLCADPGPGAFTGEVSGTMLHDVGCTHVLVGHSERRALYAEDDALIARKFQAAQAAGLVPILCVGESLDERERGVTETVVGRQLAAVLDVAGVAALSRAIIAYEPVWAISSTPGRQDATPADCREMVIFIRKILSDKFGSAGMSARIIYGGSANERDAEDFLKNGGVDGLLPGRASLDAKKFVQIIKIAEKIP